MNCDDMMKIPQLKSVLRLRAGGAGLNRPIRWIYFADALECIKTEYRVEDYVHGGEFVVLTSPRMTGDVERLMAIVPQLRALHIAALGINEGQISEALIRYCDAERLPLFELSERYPLVDLSQLLCQRIVTEQNTRSAEQLLLSSIIDAEHLNRDNVYAQARLLGIDLSGYFCVAEFAFAPQKDAGAEDPLALGRAVRRIVCAEFSARFPSGILTQLQAGSVLSLVPAGKLAAPLFREILETIVHRVQAEYRADVTVGVGEDAGCLEDVRESRAQAAAAIRIAEASRVRASVVFYREQGLYTLLSHVSDGRFLDEFSQKRLGKLLYADEVSDGHLCETLECYLTHNLSQKDTAAALFIHRNTLSYRLGRIREILGKEYTDIDSCLELRLAFMIRNLRGR